MKAAAMQDFALARYATRGWLRRGSEVCGISKDGYKRKRQAPRTPPPPQAGHAGHAALRRGEEAAGGRGPAQGAIRRARGEARGALRGGSCHPRGDVRLSPASIRCPAPQLRAHAAHSLLSATTQVCTAGLHVNGSSSGAFCRTHVATGSGRGEQLAVRALATTATPKTVHGAAIGRSGSEIEPRTEQARGRRRAPPRRGGAPRCATAGQALGGGPRATVTCGAVGARGQSARRDAGQ